MTVWLEHREKMQQHMALIEERQQNHHQGRHSLAPLEPPLSCAQRIKMAWNPSLKAVSFHDIPAQYGAYLFQDVLGNFIAQFNNPEANRNALHGLSRNTLLPFCTVPVYHNIKFTNNSDTTESEIVDVIHAQPEQKDLHGQIIPSWFDTALVQNRGMFGPYRFLDITNWHLGCWVVQVCMVFQIPEQYFKEVFPSTNATSLTHLAYVEWFTPLLAVPEPKHLMYKVSRMMSQGKRCADIIPVDSILRSVHLIPKFGPVTPQEWNTFTVLNQCHTFYVNPFTDVRSYLTFV